MDTLNQAHVHMHVRAHTHTHSHTSHTPIRAMLEKGGILSVVLKDEANFFFSRRLVPLTYFFKIETTVVKTSFDNSETYTH